MSTDRPVSDFFFFGLPPGSVRALLTIQITGLFLLLVMMPEREPPLPPVEMPTFLFALLPMVLLFFAAHGRSIRPKDRSYPSPLFLPRGVIRFLLIAAFIGVIGYQYHLDRTLLETRLTPRADQLWQWPPVLLALGLGFLLGHLTRIGPWRDSPTYQNIVAWVALLAMIGLLVETVIEVVIKPGLRQEWDTLTFECITTAVVAFYYGARS
jgi:hypothetical protein